MSKPHFIPEPCTPGAFGITEPPRCIQVDEGYSISELADGARVFMHKKHPGIYLNVHGHEVSEAVARQAGFDVERYRREALKRDKMAEASAIIEAELTQQVTPEATVIEERGGYKLVDVGYSRFVITLDEEPVTPKAVTLSLAKSIMAKLAPAEAASAA